MYPQYHIPVILHCDVIKTPVFHPDTWNIDTEDRDAVMLMSMMLLMVD